MRLKFKIIPDLDERVQEAEQLSPEQINHLLHSACRGTYAVLAVTDFLGFDGEEDTCKYIGYGEIIAYITSQKYISTLNGRANIYATDKRLILLFDHGDKRSLWWRVKFSPLNKEVYVESNFIKQLFGKKIKGATLQYLVAESSKYADRVNKGQVLKGVTTNWKIFCDEEQARLLNEYCNSKTKPLDVGQFYAYLSHSKQKSIFSYYL